MAKKSLSNLSSDELYEMARVRAEEEEAVAREEAREQIDALRSQRKELASRHRKELAAIDAEIRKLGGRTGSRGQKRGGGNVTDHVLDIVKASKKISTKEIKVELENRGVVANNLAQTLAYLKRQGKVSSPSRSIYSPL